MNKKGAPNMFHSFHTPSLDRNPSSDTSLLGQFETKLSPGAACYQPRSESEPLLPEVPFSHSPDTRQNVRPQVNLPRLMVNQMECNNHCSCCQPSQLTRPKDYGSENIHPTPSPQPCPHQWFSHVTDNPSRASMSDIELAMNDDEGQNVAVHGSSSRLSLSGHLSANRCFNITSSPIDNVKQPIFPVPPQTLHMERCTDDYCDGQCGWHYCVLKYPQFVKWQDEVRTVLLKRLPNESFGFSTKALKPVKEEKEEMYVLVTKVRRKSKAARNGLAVGDMILSVNGNPLQTVEKYHGIDFKGSSELKMQIQRPLQLLDKATDVLKSLSKAKPDLTKSRMKEPLSPSTSPDQVPVMEKQPFETIPLISIKRSESKPAVTSHYLPQARIFLCGNCTLDFVRCLFGNLITVSADSQASTYQISMEMLPDGNVRMDNSKAFSYVTQDPTNSSINVEVIAVLNDNFFLNFCPWMFTPRSIFIVTFDTRKLSLSNDAEMARLSTLANNILSHIPINSENLQLFGMKQPGDDATLEEVQTLFYTSLAASLPEPKIFSLSATDKKAINGAQQDLFNLLTQISQKQKVLSITTNAIDRLIITPNLIVSQHELYHTLPEWIITSSDVNHFFRCVLEDLKATGNLLEVGRGTPWEEQREFIIPCKFFECLARLIQGMEKEPASWTLSSNFPGLLREIDLLELVGKEAPCAGKIIGYMKELSIVLPVRWKNHDSGFCEGANFLLPYFIEDRALHLEPENYQEMLLAESSNTMPISAFFHLLSDLSFHEHCVIAGIESQSLFRIYFDQVEVFINLDKDKIHIFTRRNQKLPGKQWLQEFVETSLSHHTIGSVVCKEPSEVFEESPVQTCATPTVTDPMEQLVRPEDQVNNEEERWIELRQEEEARLLGTPVIHFVKLHDPLERLYVHMSINDNWKQWAGHLGLTLNEVAFYRSIIQNRVSPAGRIFFETYVQETRCCLGFILSSLLGMTENDRYCSDLASQLWQAAWRHNANWPPLG